MVRHLDSRPAGLVGRYTFNGSVSAGRVMVIRTPAVSCSACRVVGDTSIEEVIVVSAADSLFRRTLRFWARIGNKKGTRCVYSSKSSFERRGNDAAVRVE